MLVLFLFSLCTSFKALVNFLHSTSWSVSSFPLWNHSLRSALGFHFIPPSVSVTTRVSAIVVVSHIFPFPISSWVGWLSIPSLALLSGLCHIYVSCVGIDMTHHTLNRFDSPVCKNNEKKVEKLRVIKENWWWYPLLTVFMPYLYHKVYIASRYSIATPSQQHRWCSTTHP